MENDFKALFKSQTRIYNEFHSDPRMVAMFFLFYVEGKTSSQAQQPSCTYTWNCPRCGSGKCIDESDASQAQQPPLSNIKTSDERFNEWLLHTDKSISAGSYGSTKMKEFRADEIKELRAILQSQAQQESKEIGDMRENGVNWYGKNPHAFPVGTKFIAIPPAPEGGEK